MSSNIDDLALCGVFLSIQFLGVVISLFSFMIACDLIYDPKKSAIGAISALFCLSVAVCFVMLQTALLSSTLLNYLTQLPIITFFALSTMYTGFVLLILLNKVLSLL